MIGNRLGQVATAVMAMMVLISGAAGLAAAGADAANPPPPAGRVGTEASRLVLRDINGEPVKLSWLPQRTLAIVFWRIGNPEASARTLHAISEVIQVAKYQGIDVLWVNLGDSHEGVARFWREHGPPGRVILEPQSQISRLATAYGVKAAPCVLFVNANRELLKQLTGPVSVRSVTKALEAIGYKVSTPLGSAFLSGRVGAGEEVAGVEIGIWPHGESGGPTFTLYTDAKGHFELPGLAPGECKYYASHLYPSGGGGYMFRPGTWHLRPGRNQVVVPISGIYDTSRFSGDIPDVVDLTEKEACEQLWKRHFNIAKILREHSKTVAVGYAIRTVPSSGAQVDDRNVVLYVSEEIGASATHSVSADATPTTVSSGNTNQSVVVTAGVRVRARQCGARCSWSTPAST